MRYIPDRAHWIWLDCDPQAGHEQAGMRLALVLTTREFNKASGLCIVCPVTTTKRGLRTHVPIPPGEAVKGFILVDHLKSLDFKARRIRQIGSASKVVLEDVVDIVVALVDPL